jgi:hypothetical protein
VAAVAQQVQTDRPPLLVVSVEPAQQRHLWLAALGAVAAGRLFRRPLQGARVVLAGLAEAAEVGAA